MRVRNLFFCVLSLVIFVLFYQFGFTDEAFQFKEENGKQLILTEGEKPIFVYRFDIVEHEWVPTKNLSRRAGCYIHPLYGLNGEILTDNAPKDHFHHHGVFWTWPHVGVHTKEGKVNWYDLWTSNTALKQHFVRWIDKQISPSSASFEVENGWFIGEPADKNKIMYERVKVIVHRIQTDDSGLRSRAIDLQIVLKPIDNPISLRGSAGKSYGGLSIRFKPYIPENERKNKNAESKRSGINIITTPEGNAKTDLSEKPLAWADYTSKFDNRDELTGATIFVPKSHPDYPPTWLVRYYGPLCLGWPGVKERLFPPDKEINLKYRIWIHDKKVTTQQIQKYYDNYNQNQN
ncbi:MAG: PmoA family protein [Planctomycetaceae bacterium]|jgi:hypothetical protein|nr:PmoA family protein [Planctomycetaceae bacterium]